MKITLLHLTILFNISTCRDFYLGMFKKNDLLMSQDTLFRERVPFRFTVANYGRKYKCPITYVRVLDRLNIGRGPRVQIIRGGLRKNYIVLRLTSPYNNPISVNIMVGCENKKHTRPPWKIIRPTKKTKSTDSETEPYKENETTTNEPITTTIADTTTPTPAETTPTPTETTTTPAETTPTPAETTTTPAETTPTPSETTPTPAETTSTPSETTPTPAGTTPTSTESTMTPAADTSITIATPSDR